MGIENRAASYSSSDEPAHYPSWGLKTFVTDTTVRGRADSLPLMGIENPRNGRAGTSPQGSLPLMGIENLKVGDRWRTSEDLSLPLMGIENEPESAPPVNMPIPHYPSWGLKTLRDRTPDLGRTDLITPHGD